MAATKTALDTTFLWHQFKAGSRLRFLLMPIALVFLVAGAWVGSWTAVIGGSLIGTLTTLEALYPEKNLFRALGMNAARARSQLLIVTAPVVVTAGLMYLIFVPGVKGVTGALIAAFCGLVFVATHDAVGDQARLGETESQRIRPSGSLLVQTMWWPPMIGAVIGGAALALTTFISTFLDNSTLSSIVRALPVLLFFFWFGTEASTGGHSPLVAHSYGFTRKTWAVHALLVSIASGAIFGVIAAAGSILLPIDPAGVKTHAFIVVSIAVAAFGIFCAGTGSKASAFTPAAGFLLWFGVRDLLQFGQGAQSGRSSFAVLAISAGVALIGLVLIALYISGKINLTTDNIRRMSSVGGDT